jgi:hypothetical protein
MPGKAMASIVMLITWEVWKERNRRLFQCQEMSTMAIMSVIKQEARAWVAAGAKDLAYLILRE